MIEKFFEPFLQNLDPSLFQSVIVLSFNDIDFCR